MSCTLVTINRSGWTKLDIDPFFQQYSYLYHLQMERVLNCGLSDNFCSYKQLTVEYFVDRKPYRPKFKVPKSPPDMPAWHADNLKLLASPTTETQWWRNVYIGESPGIYAVSDTERKSNPNYLGFYDDYAKAKISFTSSVQQGYVYREQQVFYQEKMDFSSEEFGTMCDSELVTMAKSWHVVTVGRSPGVFVAEMPYTAHSTAANIGEIEGGTATVFSTWGTAVKHFANALAAGSVERVTVLLIRENMVEADYPGLITPWIF